MSKVVPVYAKCRGFHECDLKYVGALKLWCITTASIRMSWRRTSILQMTVRWLVTDARGEASFLQQLSHFYEIQHADFVSRSFAIASAMFMNSNSLPIALMQSLVVTVPGLKWDEDDNGDAMVGRALTYLVLYSTLGMIVSFHKARPSTAYLNAISDFQVRWSYGVRLLSHADPEGTDTPVEGAQGDSAVNSETATETGVECPTITVNGVGHTDPKFFYSFPNSPSRLSNNLPQASTSSVYLTSGVDDDADDDDDEDTIEVRRRRRDPITPSSSPFQARIRRLRHRIKKALKGINEFMTVPLWAALASLAVACIRPVQHVLEEHMEWFKGALNQAGDVSIPLTLVVLGAYFYTPLTEEEKLERSRKALPRHADDEEEARGRSISTTVSQMSLVDNVREMFKLAPRRKNSEERRRQKEKSRPGETKTVVVARMTALWVVTVSRAGAIYFIRFLFGWSLRVSSDYCWR